MSEEPGEIEKYASLLGIPEEEVAILLPGLSMEERKALDPISYWSKKLDQTSEETAALLKSMTPAEKTELERRLAEPAVTIEIDEAKRKKQVEEVTSSEFFQGLRARAAEIRANSQTN